MSMALKCPNPSCPYLFDPTTVPPGVVLACPRCGMRFTLGAPAAAPPPAQSPNPNDATLTYPGGATPTLPPAPGYAPPGYAPGYPTSPAADPTEAAFGGMTPETARADGEEGPRLPVRASGLQTGLLITVVVAALAAAGVAVWYKMTHKPSADPVDPTSYVQRVNLGIDLPPAPWEQDAETKKTLDAPYMLVFKRGNPDAWMAIGARDYDVREPRGNELRDELINALNKLIDPTTRREFVEDAPKTWMGQDVRGFKFTGMERGTGTSLEGEAVAISYRGIAYWFLSWTTSDMYAEQKADFAAARGRCRLLDLRNGWKAKQSSVTSYKNNEVGYTLRDPDGTWTEVDDDERKKAEGADKVLTVAIGNKKNRQTQGTLLVYVVPGGGDPLAEARTLVTSKRVTQLKAVSADFDAQFTDRTDPPTEAPSNTVEKSSEPFRLHSRVKNALGQDRLHVVSATKAGDQLVVAHAWCNWDERDDLEAMFIQVVGSLKADR